MIAVAALMSASYAAGSHLLGRPIHFVGSDQGFYHENCPANWDTPSGRCPTAGDEVDLDNHQVIFKDWHQTDDIAFEPSKSGADFGDAGKVVISGSSGKLVIAEGNFMIVNEAGSKHVNTPAPTPAPTPSPTPVPTPACAVTCQKDETGHDFEGMVNGHKWTGSAIKAGRIVATHDIRVVNLQDSYTRHRCYHTAGSCVCECLDTVEFEIDRHEDVSPERLTMRQSMDHAGRMPKQEIFKEEQSRFSGDDKDGKLKVRKQYKANAHFWEGAPDAPYREGDVVTP